MASILSSLMIVLLCISYHSCKCNARSFRVIHKDMAKKNQPLITKENDEKLNPSRVSTQPNDINDEKEKKKMINGESILDEAAGKHTRAITKGESTKVSDTVENDSPSYVSWRLPHEKRGEQEPGFNLDYLPPKTHPPVHN